MKTSEDFDSFTGDLKKDTQLYMQKHKETTLKGIFNGKITNNTVHRKIREIILLFDEKDHGYIQQVFEDILEYKIEPVVKEQPEEVEEDKQESEKDQKENEEDKKAKKLEGLLDKQAIEGKEIQKENIVMGNS